MGGSSRCCRSAGFVDTGLVAPAPLGTAGFCPPAHPPSPSREPLAVPGAARPVSRSAPGCAPVSPGLSPSPRSRRGCGSCCGTAQPWVSMVTPRLVPRLQVFQKRTFSFPSKESFLPAAPAPPPPARAEPGRARAPPGSLGKLFPLPICPGNPPPSGCCAAESS